MEEMNRNNDQGLGLPWNYIMVFLFCTELFDKKRKNALYRLPSSPFGGNMI